MGKDIEAGLQRAHSERAASVPTWPEESSERRLESFNHTVEGLNIAWTCALLYRPQKALHVSKHDCNKWKHYLRTITLAVSWAWDEMEVDIEGSAWATVMATGKNMTHLNQREGKINWISYWSVWLREVQENSATYSLNNRKSWTEIGNRQWPCFEGEEHQQFSFRCTDFKITSKVKIFSMRKLDMKEWSSEKEWNWRHRFTHNHNGHQSPHAKALHIPASCYNPGRWAAVSSNGSPRGLGSFYNLPKVMKLIGGSKNLSLDLWRAQALVLYWLLVRTHGLSHMIMTEWHGWGKKCRSKFKSPCSQGERKKLCKGVSSGWRQTESQDKTEPQNQQTLTVEHSLCACRWSKGFSCNLSMNPQ